MKIASLATVVTLAALCAVPRPAAAGPDQDAAVSATVSKLTSPSAGQLDNLFEVMSTGDGFLVTWARSVGSVPPFTLLAQRFDARGRKLGQPARIAKPGTIGDHVEMVPAGPGAAVLAWSGAKSGKRNVTVGKLDLKTMKMSGVTAIGPSDDHIHDLARLSNGNIAVVTQQIQPLPLPGRYRNMLKILSPSLKTVKDWQSVHGTGFPLDPWSYIDLTVVDLKSGGMALFRDHVGNRIVGRVFGNGGALGKAVDVSTTAFAPFSVLDIAFLEVKAARLTNGGAAVCWTLPTGTTGRYDVRCRVVSSKGIPQGRDVLVSAASEGRQAAPEVVALPNGRFAVTWVDYGGIFPAAVKVRAFRADGSPIGPERIGNDLSATLSSDALQTEGALLKDGSIVNVIGPDAFVPGLRVGGIAKPAGP